MRPLIRFWWLLLVLPAACAALAYGYVAFAGRTYTATAALMIFPPPMTGSDGPPDVQTAIMLAKSYGRLVATSDVLAATATTLGLPETASTLASRVRSSAEADTQVIDILVEDRDPARAAAIANAVGVTFIRWIGQRNASAGVEAARVGMVASADVPLQPNGPSLYALLGTAIATGLLLAVAAAYVLDRLDRRIWSERDVARAVDTPVLARLTRPAVFWRRSRLVVVTWPLSRASDAFRTLWLKLGLGEAGAGGASDGVVKAVVVTSAGPASGKSAVAANLALSLAQAGQRVVLVDANLRAPSLDRLFRLPARAGLANLLAGAGGWISDHLVDGPVPELKLMLVGSTPPEERERFAVRPLELATAVELLVAALHASGALVVIDAPPILEASDALVFTRVASRLLMVVQEGQTRPQALVQALADARATGDAPVSLVLASARW
ncbi:MAG: P-loop NTPase [Chloroflexota bacterium]